jgi:hypothetical protein
MGILRGGGVKKVAPARAGAARAPIHGRGREPGRDIGRSGPEGEPTCERWQVALAAAKFARLRTLDSLSC